MTTGKIIILNGASSSGKTTVVRALQEVCAEPYVDAGVDRFLWMLPKRYLDRPLWDDVLGLGTQSGQVGQFPIVHARAVYDLEVDTSLTSPEECALLIKKRVEDGNSPYAFRRLRERGLAGP